MDAYLATHYIAASLAEKYDIEADTVSSILLSIYILTGCDTVSYPYRKGQKRAFKIATENMPLPLASFGEPGESLDVKEDTILAGRHYFMSLYDRSDFTGTFDALCAHLFANTNGDLRCLPLTEDAFNFTSYAVCIR